MLAETNECNYLGVTFSIVKNSFETNCHRLKDNALRTTYAAISAAHWFILNS